MYEAKTAVFKAPLTALGAKNIPLNKELFWLKLAPNSFPIPGAVSLSATILIKSVLPAIYPPVDAIPPPRFFINEPTVISTPTWPGSLVSTSSP